MTLYLMFICVEIKAAQFPCVDPSFCTIIKWLSRGWGYCCSGFGSCCCSGLGSFCCSVISICSCCTRAPTNYKSDYWYGEKIDMHAANYVLIWVWSKRYSKLKLFDRSLISYTTRALSFCFICKINKTNDNNYLTHYLFSRLKSMILCKQVNTNLFICDALQFTHIFLKCWAIRKVNIS